MLTNKDLRKWQKRLGLMDWRIFLRVDVHPQDMALKDAVGTSDWREVGKTAVIQILGERYYGNRVVPFDPEKTLIHELLHLKLSLLQDSDDDLQDRLVHQLIDDLARALIDAERNKT